MRHRRRKVGASGRVEGRRQIDIGKGIELRRSWVRLRRGEVRQTWNLERIKVERATSFLRYGQIAQLPAGERCGKICELANASRRREIDFFGVYI
jgi:hypothetical protein